MSRTIAIVLLTLAAIGAAGAALNHYGDARYEAGVTAGEAKIQGRWDAANKLASETALTATKTNATVESDRKGNVSDAQSAATVRTTVNSSASAGARTELAGLRDDLARARATAAGGELSRSALDACRVDLAARDAVLGAMADAGEGMAEAAAGHASDSLMLQGAWPKK